MRIDKWYDMHLKINNPIISAYVYKACKGLVNWFYPKTVRLEKGIDSNSNTIVSMTSFPDRINDVWITLATILNQTKKPKAIILWLAEDQFPNKEKDLPEKLLELKKYGLTIRFCDNLFPHKKYYYTMQENPDATVITVDDDVFYPEYLVEELENMSSRFPGAICCTWAHEIALDQDGHILPYKEWKHGIHDFEEPKLRVMPVGIGGVLYPPHCLDERVFDKEKIGELCIRTDDIWLKAMAVLKGTPSTRIAKVYQRTYFTQLNTQKSGLRYENVGADKNDVAIDNILKSYREIEALLNDNK